MISLKTARLWLRPFQASDLESFAAYRSDPEVARYQSWTTPFTLDQAVDFFAKMKIAEPGSPGSWYQLAVERQSRPGLIGDCAFQVLAEEPLHARIGYTFSREFQRQGFATEAVGRLLDYLFGELHLRCVTATCDVENLPSIRLLERLGMRREAHPIEKVWFKGAWSSENRYTLLHQDWSQRHQS